jgi:hypothetical protein
MNGSRRRGVTLSKSSERGGTPGVDWHPAVRTSSTRSRARCRSRACASARAFRSATTQISSPALGSGWASRASRRLVPDTTARIMRLRDAAAPDSGRSPTSRRRTLLF